ncbi:MAG: FlgD immunoglobulin-like domain containing protein, partial [Candidatus Eiseniibacteriota bacterium]
DNSGVGASWVFTRSGGVWTQQGSKLVGTGSVGGPEQGYYARLSGDGNTAIVGGPLDNSNTGAAWVFTRSGSVWSQQGAKIVPSGFVGIPYMGQSVAVSGDGNTAMLGGPFDNFQTGAAWVFTRTAGVWTQHGSKLVGTGGVGTGYQGISVALSSDGYTALVGGSNDNANVGAGWVYVDPSAPAAVEPGALAGMLELAPPFPNPSAGRIAITFSLPRDADVSLGVYDVSGRFVRTLAQGATSAGSHSIQWDGRTASGRSAPGGLYFLNLRAGADELTRRFVLVK